MLVHFFQVGNLAIDVFERITASMNGLHLANGPGPDPFAELANGATGMALVTELRHHFMLPGGNHERADFMDVVSQRLFAINMLDAPHGLHRDDGMTMIGRADDH